MTESFAELFEQSIASQRIRPGTILNGLIVEVGQDYVIVNVGLKSEAVIPSDQFKNEKGEIEVAVGETVEVALDSVEDGSGETRLSREKAKRARTWTRLETAFEKQEVVIGIITGRVKGGFTVEIDNVRAFLPGSLVDVRPVRDPSYLENKPLEFKVIKLDQKRNNVVVSRRAVVEQEYSAERSALLDNLVEGAAVKGVVKNLTDYGAFVDLGGIEAREASVRSGQGRRRNRCAHPEVRPRTAACLVGVEATGRRSVAEHRAALSGQYAPVRQGHEYRRLRLLR
jgi:small subunit ribosomal protein S1